jgi:hypothetical protein
VELVEEPIPNVPPNSALPLAAPVTGPVDIDVDWFVTLLFDVPDVAPTLDRGSSVEDTSGGHDESSVPWGFAVAAGAGTPKVNAGWASLSVSADVEDGGASDGVFAFAVSEEGAPKVKPDEVPVTVVAGTDGAVEAPNWNPPIAPPVVVPVAEGGAPNENVGPVVVVDDDEEEAAGAVDAVGAVDEAPNKNFWPADEDGAVVELAPKLKLVDGTMADGRVADGTVDDDDEPTAKDERLGLSAPHDGHFISSSEM